jgi:hypothetical protein
MAVVRTDVSEENIAPTIRVGRVGELGTTFLRITEEQVE